MMAKAKAMKVPVTERSVVARVNRWLQANGEQLKPARSERVRAQVGDWFILDVKLNGVVREDVSLEVIARELGALRDWEVML
jgi:hypothetical protein